MTAASLFSLEGRVAIVTGASRGIGAAIAEGLAQAGACVIGLARSAATAEMAGPALAGPGVWREACDVTDADRFVQVCDDVMRRFGRIDILVNAAGISLAAQGLEAFDTTLAVDLRAPYLTCTIVAEHMKKARGGSIINVTSLGSMLGFPGNPAYVAAKGGLRMLTRALADDLGGDGIRVNNLAPGYIRTAMTEKSYSDPVEHQRRLRHTMLGRWGQPGDLVGPAVFLASDASGYVTGQDIFVDGGWTAKGLT